MPLILQELNHTGSHLLYRDKRRHLSLYNIARQERTTLLTYAGYVQWVPQVGGCVQGWAYRCRGVVWCGVVWCGRTWNGAECRAVKSAFKDYLTSAG